MVLYQFSRLKLIGELVVTLIFFINICYFLYLLFELIPLRHGVEYFLSYIAFFGLLSMLFYFYFNLKAFLAYLYTIILQEASLIYKKEDNVLSQFNLSEIESIIQKQASQIFVLHLKNKKKFLLPFRINQMPLFLKTLTDNYYPKKYYQVIKAKKRRTLSTVLVIVFLPIILLPLLITPYLIFIYLLAFLFTLMVEPDYIKVSDDILEITNKSKTVFIKQENVKSLQLKHMKMKYGDLHRCMLITTDDKIYTLSNYDVSDIDLYCLLTHWLKNQDRK